MHTFQPLRSVENVIDAYGDLTGVRHAEIQV
jgi:hypothetical protein